jgi:hypothetical protein
MLTAAAISCLAYLLAEVYMLSGDLGFPLDDSWIHLQFARNLAAGEGLSYDGGVLVTGSTAPLWTALLSLAFVFWGNPLWWAKLFGISLHLCGVHATFMLARELGLRRSLAVLAGGLTLSTSWLVWSALSGMEIPLFIALSLWGMILHIRELRNGNRFATSLVVLGLAMLARPEGALLLLLAIGERVLCGSTTGGRLRWPRAQIRKTLLGLAPVICLVLPVLLFYQIVGSSILPTTFAVKASGMQHWVPQMSYLRVVLGIFFVPHPLMALLALGGFISLLRRYGDARSSSLLPGLWLLGLPLAYSLLSQDGARVLVGNAGRYHFPLFPVLIVMGVLGLENALDTKDSSWSLPWKRSLIATVVALAIIPTVVDLCQGALRYAHSISDVQDSDVKMARWLGDHLSPEALLAVNDIGALKYFLPNPMVDLAGIVNPEIQKALQGAMERKTPWQDEMREILAEHRPDYLIVFPEWFPGLLSPESGFVPEYVLENPDNRTMGGSRLVAFSTPWTRYPLEGVSKR